MDFVFAPTFVWSSPFAIGSTPWSFSFTAQYPACPCPCLRFASSLSTDGARLGVRMGHYSFPVRLFHSRHHAGLSRRTAKPNFHQSVRQTLASRAVKQLKKSPPPGPQLRGPSEVFRIVKVIRISRPHDSLPGIDSCCTVTPFPGLQWAATPKLTMIAGAGNFPSGSSRCESSLLNPTIAGENAESS